MAKFSELLALKLPKNSFNILNNDSIPKGIQQIEGYNVVEIRNINAYDEYAAYDMARSIRGLLDHFISFLGIWKRVSIVTVL